MYNKIYYNQIEYNGELSFIASRLLINIGHKAKMITEIASKAKMIIELHGGGS
jgi:hypothetical protein